MGILDDIGVSQNFFNSELLL